MIYNAPTQDLDLRVGLVGLSHGPSIENNSPPKKRKPLFRAPQMTAYESFMKQF